MEKRRSAWTALLLAMVLLAVSPASAGSQLRSDGIHTESWIKSLTFMDLREDLAEAVKAGKTGLVVIFEQVGCGACQKLHEVNFADPDVVAYVTAHFDVLQVNMYGDNELTDLDGEVMAERAYNEKMLINFSPTTVFIGPQGTEVFRVPGYLQPYYYRGAFEYVVDGGPAKGVLFPRWLKEKRSNRSATDGTGGKS